MQLDEVELFEGMSELSSSKVCQTTLVLEPHRLHLVDINLSVIVIAAEHFHRGVSLLNFVYLEQILGALRVEVAISQIELACLFSQH